MRGEKGKARAEKKSDTAAGGKAATKIYLDTLYHDRLEKDTNTTPTTNEN